MHHAGTGPEDHASAGDFHEVAAEVLIGDEQNFLFRWDSIDDFACVAAGHDPVDKAFDGGRGVDVGDGVKVATFFA